MGTAVGFYMHDFIDKYSNSCVSEYFRGLTLFANYGLMELEELITGT